MGTSYLFVLLFLVTTINAGPLKSNSIRLKRDGENINVNRTGELNGCVLDNIEYKPGDEVPSLGPCERCVCEAPDVVCSMIKCQPNSGCKIIQQSGQCCPEYKCDCEYNGRIYNNGERLDKPEDPCQVCYCKGGEIMCTSITCYERDDCKPHFSPGQCCPRYDHCPVETGRVSVNSVRSVNASLYSPKREMQPWPLTKPSNVPSSVNYDEASGAHNNVYPQTIKIVEILPTTPGYSNKPGEVSVIPRVKTNDQKSKDHEVESIEEGTTSPSSTTENTDLASSTSEIEHLLDTTPESDVKNSEQKNEAVPERSVSTLNPESEEIYRTSTPDPQPDSQKFSTVFPNYYHTEGELNALEEVTTAESVTEVEGSGYEVLTGGIYEDTSSESQDIQSTTSRSESDSEGPTISNEGVSNVTQDSSISETYSATEPYNSQDNSSYTIGYSEKNVTNDEDSEVDSSNENFEQKSELRFASFNNSEEVPSSGSSSEENISDLSDNENSNSTSEVATDNNNPTSPENLQSSSVHLSTNAYEVGLESSSEHVDNSTTFNTESPTAQTSESFHSDSTINLNIEYMSDSPYDKTSIHPVDMQSETSTQVNEASEINEWTTEYDLSLTNDRPRLLVPEGRKKSSRLTLSKHDSEVKYFENPTALTIPPVLNVHSLEYNEMSPQTESAQSENVSSVAKVEIYHPAKPNEMAGFVTVVDDKTNVTSADGKTISSHILLTPNDLKKLAEILIHEKIKPASLDDKERKANSGVNSDEVGTPSSVQRSASEKSWENKSLETSEIIKSDTENSQSRSDSDMAISQGEDFRNFISSTLPSNKVMRDSNLEDPNTSRQIRIPDNGSQQYTALLDDRDLLILENFFRKNIGFQ